MTGRITLIGAGELMSAMSALHRAALRRLGEPPRPVFLDTTAGFETNVDAIVEKAIEYYAHHLQTTLRVARFRHRDKATASEVAAAVAEVKAANLIFAGPGSPSYATRQWQASPVWEAVESQFLAGADILFASAASIALGRYTLPVYEIYKAGEDPFWIEGLNLLGHLGLDLAVIPHYDDNSGGENYDSRFCYMGAERFDLLQERLPSDVSILGIDAYTAVCFDPSMGEATISGQGGVTLIGEGGSRRFEAGSAVPFEEFRSRARGVVQTYDAQHAVKGYEFADGPRDSDDPFSVLASRIEALPSLGENEKVDLLSRVHALRERVPDNAVADKARLIDLVLELRRGLREAKRFDLADHARDVLEEDGIEVQDTPEGARWTLR